MKKNQLPKLPRMFQIKFETKNGKSGFIMYKSYMTDSGEIKYNLTYSHKKSDASHFLGYEHTKEIAKKLNKQYNLGDVYIIEDNTKKEVYVPKAT